MAEAIGIEPSPDISIDAKRNAPLPTALTLPIDQLISRVMADRPDLIAQMLEIRRADDEIRAAKSDPSRFRKYLRTSPILQPEQLRYCCRRHYAYQGRYVRGALGCDPSRSNQEESKSKLPMFGDSFPVGMLNS